MGRWGSAALAAVLMTAALPAAADGEELRLERDGAVSSVQRVHVPRTGWYTLSARMRTSTGEIEAFARLCGTRERLWAPPGCVCSRMLRVVCWPRSAVQWPGSGRRGSRSIPGARSSPGC